MRYITVTLASILLSAPAHAQIIYSPGANGVPTMGGAALVLLCLMLVWVAYKRGLVTPQGLNTVAALCLTGAAVTGFLGGKLISDAYAGGGGMVVMGLIDSPTGGQVPITASALNVFENTSGVVQRIDDVIVPGSCGNGDSGIIDGAPRCVPGRSVSSGASGMCYTDCR